MEGMPLWRLSSHRFKQVIILLTTTKQAPLPEKGEDGQASSIKGKQLEGKMIVTSPAVQKHFVNIFFVFAWEFCIEKWRGFLVNFFWAPFPTKRSTKNPRKIRGKFGAKFGAKFGTKFLKIRGTFGLQLF